MKIQKKIGGGGRGSGGGGGVGLEGGGQCGCERRIEDFVKIQKKIKFGRTGGWVVGGGSGWGLGGQV